MLSSFWGEGDGGCNIGSQGFVLHSLRFVIACPGAPSSTPRGYTYRLYMLERCCLMVTECYKRVLGWYLVPQEVLNRLSGCCSMVTEW